VVQSGRCDSDNTVLLFLGMGKVRKNIVYENTSLKVKFGKDRGDMDLGSGNSRLYAVSLTKYIFTD